MVEFRAWPKTPRLYRKVTITEKIDGSNAAVIVNPEPMLANWESGTRFAEGVTVNFDGRSHLLSAQSRKRVITPDADNFGFAGWAWDNAQYLADTLGEGYHYGEWWGQGIQRRYGMDKKVFSLFNVRRWLGTEFELDELRLVPVLYQGDFDMVSIDDEVAFLSTFGSKAAPGFMNPEGICVFHEDANQVFKVLIENDHLPKSEVLKAA